MLDVLIAGADVVDGTGAPRQRADVGVRDGRIVNVGPTDEPARRTIDATGLVVTPGFVDVHTHYDAQLMWDPWASPSPLHGVTTVLNGNCGFSLAPVDDAGVDYISRMMARVEGMPLRSLQSLAWDWRTFGDYLDRLDGRVGVNAGFLVGHSTIRRLAMGEDAVGGTATPEQLDRMVALVHDALAAGALGFSSSLGDAHTDGDGAPVPSRGAERDEILALCAAVREHPGTCLEFIPCLGEISAEKAQLMADMSLAADRPLNWNLLGSMSTTDIWEQQLTASDVARAQGAYVVALALPDLMRMRASRLLDSLPGWRELAKAGRDDRARAVADPRTRAELRAAAEKGAAGGIPALSRYDLLEVADAPDPALAGRSIQTLARERGGDEIDVLLDVVFPDRLPLTMVMPTLVPSLGVSAESWSARASIWRDPRVILGGSDAGAHGDLMCHANYTTALLGESVRERGLLPLEEAVHALTDVPARLYGLRGRGRVAEGFAADLVVLDPERVGTRSPHVREDLPGGGYRLYVEGTGIEHVFVNGSEVVTHDELVDDEPRGTVLRSGQDTDTVDLASLASA